MGRIVGQNNLQVDISKKYARPDEASIIFDMEKEGIMLLASAAGAICRLPEITIINVQKVKDYMKHLYKIPGTERYVKKLYVRVGEGSVLYSIGRHRFIEMARAAGAVYKLNEDKGGMVLINLEIFDEYMEQFRQEPTEMKHPLWGKED